MIIAGMISTLRSWIQKERLRHNRDLGWLVEVAGGAHTINLNLPDRTHLSDSQEELQAYRRAAVALPLPRKGSHDPTASHVTAFGAFRPPPRSRCIAGTPDRRSTRPQLLMTRRLHLAAGKHQKRARRPWRGSWSHCSRCESRGTGCPPSEGAAGPMLRRRRGPQTASESRWRCLGKVVAPARVRVISGDELSVFLWCSSGERAAARQLIHRARPWRPALSRVGGVWAARARVMFRVPVGLGAGCGARGARQ
jgi:hypothetical protein